MISKKYEFINNYSIIEIKSMIKFINEVWSDICTDKDKIIILIIRFHIMT